MVEGIRGKTIRVTGELGLIWLIRRESPNNT
jgi:hypothetical protein